MYQFLLPTFLLFYFLRKYRVYKWGFCKNSFKLTNKICVVTGANSGVGYEICKELAKRDAKVILACRDMDKANQAILEILKDLPKDSKSTLIPMELNLASIESILSFLRLFKESFEKLDILINNAAVSYPKKRGIRTCDNFEIHFQVNYLGPYILTMGLFEELKNGSPSRVINVSSKLHEKGFINFENLQYTEPHYPNTKLMLTYFSFELSKLWQNHKISVYSVCPGWCYTNFFRHHQIAWFHYIFLTPVAYFFMRTAQQGAQTVIYCASDPQLKDETGCFYRNCQKYTSLINFDPITSKRLFDVTDEMIKK